MNLLDICAILADREIPFRANGNMLQILGDDQPDYFIVVESTGINVSFDGDNYFKYDVLEDFTAWLDI